MKNFYQFTALRKKEIFDLAGNQTGLPESAIEKDWWVTLTLKAIFALPFSQYLVFKGGTSLSKGWNLIERFSEDIDLALDRSFLGPFKGDISKTQVVKLRKASFNFISKSFLYALHGKITEMGITEFKLFAHKSKSNVIDPLVIELQYPSVTEPLQYIQPRVLIEIGARSLIEPFKEKPVQSIVGQLFNEQSFADASQLFPIVLPKRTFLEKAFLLHEEFLKAKEPATVNRMTRHLYDLIMLMDTKHGVEALQDEKLYKAIIEHRKKFNAIRGIDYTNHSPNRIDFIPPDNLLEEWKKDYNEMKESMIYGDAPEFDALLKKLTLLRERFQKVSWQ